MKHTLIVFCALFANTTDCTSRWGASTGTTDNKEHINFYGTLLTQQGQKEPVDNILIEGKHNDIIMYDAPADHKPGEFNPKTKQTEIKLQTNPTTDFVKTKIDLSKTDTIKVSNPSIIWVYQKDKKLQRNEFLLVQVKSKGSATSKDYLLEHKTRISCSSTDQAESQKKEVPLAAIDTLTIEGYSFTLSHDKKSIKKEVSGTCPVVKTDTETTTEIVVK